ncbi:MAG: S26 family signal peptidase [Candidatus Limnocylindria bacterium]
MIRRGARWALLVLLVALARRWLDVVEVRGRSMRPTLLPGDRLVLVRQHGPPRRGSVVVARDPRAPARELVKRVGRVDARGIDLRGDDPGGSTDGRTFGRVPASAVGWRVVGRYWPPRRAGRLAAAPPVEDSGGEPACAVPAALVGVDD